MDNINWQFELGRIFGTILIPFFFAIVTIAFKRFRTRDNFIIVSFSVLFIQLCLTLFGLEQMMFHEVYDAATKMGVETEEFKAIELKRAGLAHFICLLILIFIGYLKPIGAWLKKEIF